jgi:hypothetical protein
MYLNDDISMVKGKFVILISTTLINAFMSTTMYIMTIVITLAIGGQIFISILSMS